MKVEVRRIGILRLGGVLAIIYGLGALIYLPVFVILYEKSAPEAKVEFTRTFLILVLSPALGFIHGIVAGLFYNLASRVTGGLKLNLEVEPVEREEGS